MIDYEKQFGWPEYELRRRQIRIAKVFRIVYGWLCAGFALYLGFFNLFLSANPAVFRPESGLIVQSR